MNPDHSKQLIDRYLRGECTPAEQALLERWYREQADSLEMPQLYHEGMAQHKEEGWHNLARQITRQQKIYVIRRFTRVAAVFALFMLAGLGVYWSYNDIQSSHSELMMSEVEDIAPGGNRATLRLGDGPVIELNEDHDMIVVDHRGISYRDGEKILMHVGTVPSGANSSQYVVLTTPRGGQYQVVLPDGSEVWLNASSTLRYPLAFTGNAREVELDGEAFFDVTQTPSLQPFIVRTSGQDIEVLGTQFNVSAYRDERSGRTTLLSGSVRVSNNKTAQTIQLLPGDQAVVTGDALSLHQVDADQYAAWKEGVIVLQQADFALVVKQIERWYDVGFDIEKWPDIGTLSGEVPRNVNLSEILRILEVNTNKKFEIKGRRVVMPD